VPDWLGGQRTEAAWDRIRDAAAELVLPLVLLALLMTSYALRPTSRRLPDALVESR
jgi:hypothetical protein